MGIGEIETTLRLLEANIKDLQQRVEGKQRDRLLVSHVWMQDMLEKRVKGELKTLHTELELLKKQGVDSSMENNVVMSSKYCVELAKAFQRLIEAHKEQKSIAYIEADWNQTLPVILDRFSHLKNRVSILKGLSQKKQDEDEWLDF